MILVINQSKKDALALSETFYYMGILSRGLTPQEAVREISDFYKAVIIVEPDALQNKEDFVTELRNLSSALIYSIGGIQTQRDKYIFDAMIKNQFYSSHIYDFIALSFSERNISPPGIYRCGGIDASSNLSVPHHFGERLPFTKSESMILRTLIKCYPNSIRANDILMHAFRESRLPDISNIRTHISIMNKKFKSIRGSKLINFSYNEGYSLYR